jgi:hypothetical protein
MQEPYRKGSSESILASNHALYRGKMVFFSAEFAFIDLGNTSIELIQPIGTGPSPYFDTLHEKRESTHHLAFVGWRDPVPDQRAIDI